MFARLGIQAKMFAFGSVLSAVSLAIGGVGYYTVSKVTAPYEHVVNESSPDIMTVSELLSSIRLSRSHLRSLGIPDLNAEELKTVHKSLKKGLDRIEVGIKDFDTLHLRTPEIIEQAKSVRSGIIKENKILTEVAGLEVSNAADRTRIDELIREDIVIAPIVAADMEKLAQNFVTENKMNIAQAHKVHDQGITLLFSLMAIGVLASLAAGFFFARSMSRIFLRISEELAGSASDVSSASQQISLASQQLSSGATEAAASLEETVASIEELSSVVKLNATHASDAANFSDKTQGSAESGDAELRKLVVAVNEISQSSKKIEEIINVIDDIAFQTNLLALNAAVEAARAGEQGKGFAVVAEAVRALAQRSSAAAKDISSLIKDSVSRSEHGAKLADRSGTVLKEIVDSVHKITSLNSEIASGSQEQSTGLSQISQAMNQLDQATQGNAASAEEVAATAEQMSQQAQAMHGLVHDLRVIVHGSSASKSTLHSSDARSHVLVTSRVHASPTRAVASPKKSAQNPFSVSPVQSKMRSPAKSTSKVASNAAQVIPFDDDEPSFGKVGTTDGF